MREIVGGVLRYRDLVAKINIAKFFPGVFFGDSRKFVLAKISHYTVVSRSQTLAGRESGGYATLCVERLSLHNV